MSSEPDYDGMLERLIAAVTPTLIPAALLVMAEDLEGDQ